MKTLSLEESQNLKLAEILKLLGEGEVLILTERGEGRYVVGAMEDLEWEALSLSQNQEFMTYLDACRARGDREGSLPLDEVRRRLADKP